MGDNKYYIYIPYSYKNIIDRLLLSIHKLFKKNQYNLVCKMGVKILSILL